MSETPRPKEKADMLSAMRHLEIPEGVIKYVPPLSDGERDIFGITEIFAGKIDDFEGGVTNGTVCVFNPNNIKVFFEREGISAAEINEAGKLVRDFLVNLKLRDFIKKVKAGVGILETDLAIVLAGYEDIREAKRLHELTATMVNTYGVLIKELDQAESKRARDFEETVDKLHALKVNLVRSFQLQTEIPIKRILRRGETSQ